MSAPHSIAFYDELTLSNAHRTLQGHENRQNLFLTLHCKKIEFVSQKENLELFAAFTAALETTTARVKKIVIIVYPTFDLRRFAGLEERLWSAIGKLRGLETVEISGIPLRLRPLSLILGGAKGLKTLCVYITKHEPALDGLHEFVAAVQGMAALEKFTWSYRGCELPQEVLQPILEALKAVPNLKEVYLRDVKVFESSEWLKTSLAELCGHSTLELLSMDGIVRQDLLSTVTVSVARSATMKKLIIQTILDEKGCELLQKMFQESKSLESVTVSSKDPAPSDKHYSKILNGLVHNTTLQELNIFGCPIQLSTKYAALSLVQQNKSLTNLEIGSGDTLMLTKDINFFLELNILGRKALLSNKHSRKAWVDALIKAGGYPYHYEHIFQNDRNIGLSIFYYLLLENPALIAEVGQDYFDPMERPKKRHRCQTVCYSGSS